MITRLTTSFCERTGTPLADAMHNIYPSLYLVIESNATGNANFYVTVKIKIGSQTIVPEMKFVPNQPSRITTNIAPLLVNHLNSISYDFSNVATTQTTTFTIEVKEFYNGSQQSTQTIHIKVRKAKALNTYYEDKYMCTVAGYGAKLILPTITKYYAFGSSIATFPNGHDNLITINKPVKRFNNISNRLLISMRDEQGVWLIDNYEITDNGLSNIKLNKILSDDTSDTRLKLTATLYDQYNQVLIEDEHWFDVVYIKYLDVIDFACLYYRNNADTFSTIMLYPTSTEFNLTEVSYNAQNYLYLDRYRKGGKTRTYTGTSEAVTYVSDYFDEVTTKHIMHNLLTTKETYIMRYEDDVANYYKVNVLKVNNSVKSTDIEPLHNIVITLEEDLYDNI